MTNKLALVVAVVLGALSIVGIRLYVEQLEQKQLYMMNLVDVLVASRDIPAGKVFGPEDVEIAQFPAHVMDQAFRKSNVTDKTTIIGLKTVEPISAGQVLQQYHFQKTTQRQKLNFPKEYRAITIPISRVAGVAGLLRPSDQVDILINTQMQDERSASIVLTRTLLRNVLVLAVDSNTDPFTELSSYNTVTLRLRPDECNKLAYCLYNGAAIHLTYVQPGTPEGTGYDTVTGNDIWNEVEPELRRR